MFLRHAIRAYADALEDTPMALAEVFALARMLSNQAESNAHGNLTDQTIALLLNTVLIPITHMVVCVSAKNLDMDELD